MKFLKLLFLVPFLYGFSLSAAPYFPSCPNGSTLDVKQNAKDKCIQPLKAIIKDRHQPLCKKNAKEVLLDNAGLMVPPPILVTKSSAQWKWVERSGRDHCIHKYTKKTRDIKCRSGYSLVINYRGNADECQKRKIKKSIKTVISCKSSEHKHKKKGRDVCLTNNF